MEKEEMVDAIKEFDCKAQRMWDYEGKTEKEIIEAAIMFGAEWMANQGVSKEVIIGLATSKIVCTIKEDTLDSLNVTPGDKVIVQIRKK